jgi:transketolase
MIKPSHFELDKKQGQYYKIADILVEKEYQLSDSEVKLFEKLEVLYRSLCAVLYNYVPLSGHPGGSISSGPIALNLVYNVMAYDLKRPYQQGFDILSYAAGHKALGLYALSAIRNEIAKTYAPELLPKESWQLRLEDLLGFRKAPTVNTKYFKEFNSKSLDGHPVPLTPFVCLTTGASGVGFGASVGLALAAAINYKEKAPKVNVLEGEGGLTAGRVAEALAIASRAGLDNLIIHLDWNQASIDSDKVCAKDGTCGDYVAWQPTELFYVNGLNVIEVEDGSDFKQVYGAQKFANSLNNGVPTAIVYKTIKGRKYGIEGRKSHGSGHKFASEGYYNALADFEQTFNIKIPHFTGETDAQNVENYYYQTLLCFRKAISQNKEIFEPLAQKLQEAKRKLFDKNLPVITKPQADFDPYTTPEVLKYPEDKKVALRTAMGQALQYISEKQENNFYVSTADLSGSTAAGQIAKPYDKGFYNKRTNPESRLISSGGICEDGLSAVMSGVSAYGLNTGVAASYAAFTSSMMHTAARLHAIGQQAYNEATQNPMNTFVIFSGHAGIPTGEDGPTHADPQALQLVQENFPKNMAITLTPLDAKDVWPSLTAALAKKPAVLYPFVTRPEVAQSDRAEGADASKGVYALVKEENAEGTLIIQGSGVGEIFMQQTYPKLKEEGIKLNVYYVCSRELFLMLDEKEQEQILPLSEQKRAMAISDFTMPTMYCWLKSELGQKCSIYPFKDGKYLSSGKAPKIYEQAHLDAASQLKAIKNYLQKMKEK